MRLIAALLALTALPARAADGFYIALEGGLANWSFDEPGLAQKLREVLVPQQQGLAGPLAAEFVQQIQSGPAAALRLGYNILGHASVEGFFQGTGWDVLNPSRGGGAVAGLGAAWHPLQLWLPDRPYDVWLGAGGGYGIVGESRAMDGAAMVLSFGGEYAPAPFVAFTLGVRWMLPFFARYITNYEHRNEGGSVDLNEAADGSALFPYLGVKFLFTPRR